MSFTPQRRDPQVHTADTLVTLLDQLPLQRLGPSEEAGLWVTSLPWPALPARPLSWGGRTPSTHEWGRWPGTDTPRRRYLVLDGGGPAPECLPLSSHREAPGFTEAPPRAALRFLAKSGPGEIPWEQHYLELSYAGRTIGLALGLRVGAAVHWWEACRIDVLEETPECLTVEVGGAIPHQVLLPEEYLSGFKFQLLHKHNWVNGRLFARLYANGVCEVYAHHINSRFFDDGAALVGAVPVIGFRTSEPLPNAAVWDGSTSEVEWGGVRLDLREVSRLSTPDQPGRLWQEGELTVLQPYTGCELYGGQPSLEQTGDPYILHAEAETMLRGMARTLRFSLSLSDRSPRIARYLAPGWWYGVCEELYPASYLPVRRDDDPLTANAVEATLATIHQRGFEDGLLPRTTRTSKPGRLEPGWEGEMPYALFLHAWQTGDAEVYEVALRSAYAFTDICIDHASKMVRMHGWGPNAFSVPMNRAHGPVAAWLETGDPYLLEAAEAITANAHFQHRNSWPRLAVGRDGCYLRSAVFLHRYTGSDTFLAYAREGCRHVAVSQRENGSFGDQGGGAGIHQWAAYITKPWMGLLALGGVLDLLELYPGDEVLEGAALRFADWLMNERFERHGGLGWTYQHDFMGTRDFYNPVERTHQAMPTEMIWHHDTLGRLLSWATLFTRDERYLQAWVTSYEGVDAHELDHAIASHLQFVPWVYSRLLQARWNGAEGLETTPAFLEFLPDWKFSVLTPAGTLPLCLLSPTS